MLETKRTQPRLDEGTIREIEQFLYREARLLDERRFHEWLELLAHDVHYWMPMKSNRYPRKSKAIKILDREKDVDREVTREDELALLDESKATLERRVARLDTGMAWAEDPPSRTRHLITNVLVEGDHRASEVTVYSNFIVYRTRAEREEEFYVGSREDVLRRTGDSWQIARRKIVLDQNVLLVKNVSIFF